MAALSREEVVALVQYEGLRHPALQVVAGRDKRPAIIRQFIWKCGLGLTCWAANPGGGLLPHREASSATKVGELPPSLLSSPSLVTAAACETLSDCDQVGGTVSEHIAG